MSKKMLSVVCALAISSAIPTGLMAADSSTYSNNYSTTLALIRSKNVDKMLDRVNQLKDYTKLYMYQTGDINPTAAKVATYFNLPDVALVNFTNGKIKESVDNNAYVYHYSNLFSSTPNANLQQLLKNSTKLDPLATVLNGGTDIEIPYSPTTINFVKQVKALPDNAVISPIIPNDTSKIWYQPTGDGHFNVLQYDPGQKKWIDVGSFKHEGIVVSKSDDLKNFDSIANVGTKAYVKNDNGTMDTYVYDGNDWIKTTSSAAGADIAAGAGQLFNGTATIPDLALKIFKKAGGSVATVPAPNGEWVASKDFTKKDDLSTGGYWISNDNHYVIVNNVKTLVSLNDLFKRGTYAWVPNTSHHGILKLRKTYLPGLGEIWAYQAKDLKDALRFLKQPRTPNAVSGEIVYVRDKNVYLKRNMQDNVLQPYTGHYYVSSEGRKLFASPQKGYTYLTLNNDCTSGTCYSNGKLQTDKLTTFFYAPTAARNIKGLTDAGLCNSNSSCYDLAHSKGIPVALFNNRDMIFYKNGYWVKDNRYYLGKHYNTWFGSADAANNIYHYEHGAYTYSDHSRYSDHKRWKRYATGCIKEGWLIHVKRADIIGGRVNRSTWETCSIGLHTTYPRFCSTERVFPTFSIVFNCYTDYISCCMEHSYAWGWR